MFEKRQGLLGLIHGHQNFGEADVGVGIAGLQLDGSRVAVIGFFHVVAAQGDIAESTFGLLVGFGLACSAALYSRSASARLSGVDQRAEHFGEFKMNAGKLRIELESFAVILDGFFGLAAFGEFVRERLMHARGIRSDDGQAEQRVSGEVGVDTVGGVENSFVRGLELP